MMDLIATDGAGQVAAVAHSVSVTPSLEAKLVIEEILDEYLGGIGGIADWRTMVVTDHMLTQSTCLLRAVALWQVGGFDPTPVSTHPLNLTADQTRKIDTKGLR